MNRREFILKTGLAGAALRASKAREALGSNSLLPAHHVEANGKLTLSNDVLAWHFEWQNRKLASLGFDNKISEHSFEFSASRELSLTFSASEQRIEIPWWKFSFSPDVTAVPPDEEQGLRMGYQTPELKEEDWGAVENLLLRSPSGVKKPQDPIHYEGYGWFRKWFELGSGARSKPLVFVLGGYDYQDWREYWVYLNGKEIGHRISSGRWRTPGQFSVSPNDPAYSGLRLGPGEKNLLAVRTKGYDRRFGGHSDEVLRHYVFEPVWADQFVSVGSPYLIVSDFELMGIAQPDSSTVKFELQNPAQELSLALHCQLDGSTRRKWVEVKNSGQKEMLLLDIILDDYALEVPHTEGGPGEPVFLNDEAFCAIEHPAGLNQGDDGRVRLMHFPARRIKPGEKTNSHVALVSVAKAGQAVDHFTSYIQDKSPRKKKAISLYTPYGINDQGGACSPLNDEEAVDVLGVVEKWQKKGLKFDYFTLDQGWMDNAGNLTQFAPQCYPDGPAKLLERISALGMKFGLWFSTTGGSWSCGDNPEVWPSLVPEPGDPDQRVLPSPVYRQGYVSIGGVSHRLCVASEPYFNILRNAVLYHIKNNHMKLFKLDMGNYYCNATHHNHLPGKYSVEAMYERLLDIASSARAADPDVFLIWYWGVRSPFFALHGDMVFESGLFMEGAGTSWFPALYFRDSVTLNLDQSTQFAKTLPPINKDSLGVWLAENRWGNYMAKERWKESLVMDLGRGNLVFPQLWGDSYLLDDRDIEFLSDLTALVRKNETLFLRRRNILGDPWKNEVYGYANVSGKHGFLFVHNMHFEARKAKLNLSHCGFEAPSDAPMRIISHFPEKRRFVSEGRSEFAVGESFEIWLRPFEVLMLEVSTGNSIETDLPSRDVTTSNAPLYGRALSLASTAKAAWMEMRFKDAAQFEKQGLKHKFQAWSAVLPRFGEDPHILALAIKLREGSREWRFSPAVVDVVQIVARVAGHDIKLIPVPDSRQFGNTQGMGCSWVVYKIRVNPQWSEKDLEFAVHAYVPENVEAQVEGWLVKRWWEENTRPIGDGQYGNGLS